MSTEKLASSKFVGGGVTKSTAGGSSAENVTLNKDEVH